MRLAMTMEKLVSMQPGPQAMLDALLGGPSPQGREVGALNLVERCTAMYDSWLSAVEDLKNRDDPQFTEWVSTSLSTPDSSDSQTTPGRVPASHSSVISVQPVVPSKRALADSAGEASMGASFQPSPQTPRRPGLRSGSSRSGSLQGVQGPRLGANPSGHQGVGTAQWGLGGQPGTPPFRHPAIQVTASRASSQPNFPGNVGGRVPQQAVGGQSQAPNDGSGVRGRGGGNQNQGLRYHRPGRGGAGPGASNPAARK